MKYDRLVEIIDTRLNSNEQFDSTSDFLREVVAQYMFEMMEVGFIPESALGNMEEYLLEESIEIFKKKTYGYLSLNQFRKDSLKKKRA
jgi:hypothetical protein